MSKHKKHLLRKKEHRLVFDMIKEADVTIQILDARFPHRCRSLVIESFAEKNRKPLICCINKTDLVPKKINQKWNAIISQDLPTVHISTVERLGTKIIRQKILRYSGKRPVVVCILGYPNVGKSSLINVLRGRKSAPTSIKAGYTRSLRKVVISPSITMFDTPGITPMENLSIEERVFLGTISPEDISDPDLICTLIFSQFKKQKLISSIEDYLDFPLEGSEEDILTKFAIKRGLFKKGKEPLIQEAARIIIRDFSKGKIKYYEDPDISND
ncbi:MAG: GTPase [Candidatus Hodarchaeales archaeon]|jgi:ribosome biogenesis GTPase A